MYQARGNIKSWTTSGEEEGGRKERREGGREGDVYDRGDRAGGREGEVGEDAYLLSPANTTGIHGRMRTTGGP